MSAFRQTSEISDPSLSCICSEC